MSKMMRKYEFIFVDAENILLDYDVAEKNQYLFDNDVYAA